MGRVKMAELTLDELLHPKTPLARLYHKKLLIPGWGGELSNTELKYIKGKLLSNSALRIAWGFIHGKGFRISENKIRERAINAT
jgi:hypothetical protein